MAPGGRACEILVGDTHVPLPARHSSQLHVRSSPSGRRSDSLSPTVSFERRALGPPDTACHHGRSDFFGRCCQTVERASRRHHCCPVAERFPPSAHNVFVTSLISGFYLIPVHCSAIFRNRGSTIILKIARDCSVDGPRRHIITSSHGIFRRT